MEVKLVKENGKLQIAINDKNYTPLAFRSFRPDEKNIREFYNAGVRLMCILHSGMNTTLDVPYSEFGEIWTGKGSYDFNAIDRQMKLFIDNAPEAYFNIMLMLDTRSWYLEQNPECTDTYRNLVEMAGYGKWREDTGKYLKDIITYFENNYGERIFAYSLFAGTCTEWFTNHKSNINFGNWDTGPARYNKIKEQVFREYVKEPEAALPEAKELVHTSDGIFRHPRSITTLASEAVTPALM